MLDATNIYMTTPHAACKGARCRVFAKIDEAMAVKTHRDKHTLGFPNRLTSVGNENRRSQDINSLTGSLDKPRMLVCDDPS